MWAYICAAFMQNLSSRRLACPLGVPRCCVYQRCDYETHNKPGGCNIKPVCDNLTVNIEPDRQWSSMRRRSTAGGADGDKKLMQELHLFCQQRFQWQLARPPAACVSLRIFFYSFLSVYLNVLPGTVSLFHAEWKQMKGSACCRPFMWL